MCPYQCITSSLATGHAHDSGPVWVAGPSPYGSFIRTSTPVYPGAPQAHLFKRLVEVRFAILPLWRLIAESAPRQGLLLFDR